MPVRAITPSVVNALNQSVQSAISQIYSKLKIDTKNDPSVIPISDNAYEIRVTHETVLAVKGGPKSQSAYVSTSVFSNVIQAGACDLSSSGACLIVEKDSRAGVTKSHRAFFVVRDTQTGSVTRSEVASTMKAQVETILAGRPDGSYVVTGLEFK